MIEVRDARPEEYPEIADVTVRAYRPVFGDLGDYEDDLRDVAGHAASARVLAAVVDGAVLGTATCVIDGGPLVEWPDPEAAGIRFVAVVPEAQGRGVGRALTEACVRLARDAGRPRVLLHTSDRQLAARRLYARLGFERAPELDWEPEPGLWLRGYRLELT